MPKALGLVETRGLVAAIVAADAMVKTSNVTLIGKEVTNPALVTIKVVGDVAAVKASVDAGAEAAKRVGQLVSIHVIPQPDSQMVFMIPEINDDDEGPEINNPQQPEKPAAKKDPELKTKEVGKAQPKEESQAETKKEAVQPPAKKEEPQEKVKKEIPGKKSSDRKITEIKESPVSENLFTGTSDHLEQLRREALGIKLEKEAGKKEIKPERPVEAVSLEELEKLNVHQLRKHARDTEGFPIQGREISRANRNKLLDYFRKLF
ncbi:MAG TPA: BMC domain-containing protein [Ignavibacteriaceae bacterium]|jgi:ethanolamine utilization protein EutM|nr:BMC domain-containing protein [Ignavibacteriaceae bacterium]